MTRRGSTAAAQPFPWSSLAIIAAAAEAVVIALWLIPSSVHIVSWPADGPVRVGLLGSARVLLGAAAATLAISAILVTWLRSTVWPRRLSSALAPLLLFWTWAVPYLPVLPDRMPLLLVLSGPVRWGIAGAVFLAVLSQATGVSLQSVGRMFSRQPRRMVFALSLAVYLVVGLYSSRAVGPIGDEPHYLVIVESLLKDGDLKIENNHRRGDYRPFFSGELRPDYMRRGKDGEIYSIHAPGLPALLLPAYVVAGYPGAVVFVCAIAALTALAVFDLAVAIAGATTGLLAWAAVCLTVPFIPHAWLLFPEMSGALVVAWASLWLWQPLTASISTWAWRGLALGSLPWLHTKFIVLAAALTAALLLRLWRHPAKLAALLAPLGATVGAWFGYFYVVYGTLDPQAPYGAFTNTDVLVRNIPHGLIGIFLDQKFGLLIYCPVYVAAIMGAVSLVRRRDSRVFACALLVSAVAFVASSARLYMFWGGSSPPARFLVPVLPLLAPMVAAALGDARGALARGLAGLALAASLVIAATGAAGTDRLLLLSDPHGRARILEAIQAGSPLALVVPMFTEPDWQTDIPRLGQWLAALLVALAAVASVSRIPAAATPWRIALIALGSFVLAGAVLTAQPEADIRGRTAWRGAADVLWRHDGRRLRALEYGALRRATPDRLRQLSTIAAPLKPRDHGYRTDQFRLPPGTYEAVVFFENSFSRQGVIEVVEAPRAVFGRASGALQNPTRISFELPVASRRLSVEIPDSTIGNAVERVDLVPLELVPPELRESLPVRFIEAAGGRSNGFIVYTDEHAYPEGGVFWTRGLEQTTVLVAPGGASRIVMTLFTGPLTGSVTLAVAGTVHNVTVDAEQTRQLAVDVPPAHRLVPLVIRSSSTFRPSDVDPASGDIRRLGCQVRVDLE
jgi:hypothetical protein